MTPQKRRSLHELEEIITDLTISKRALRKENETLKENNPLIQKEHQEWVQNMVRIMKTKQAKINHLKKKNELYKVQIPAESSGNQLSQLAKVADQLVEVDATQDKE